MTFIQKSTRWVLIVVGLFIAVFACQKLEKEVAANNEQNLQTSVSDRDGLANPTITNGRAIFSNPTAFEAYVLSLEGKKLDSLESAIGISSFRKFSNGEIGKERIDDVFAAVLNRDSMLQVGGDVFKLLFHEKKIYVLRNNPSESQILALKSGINSNQMPSSTRVFTFADDVWGELFPIPEPEGPIGTCADIDKRKDDDKDYCEGGDPNFDYNYKFHVKYRTAGIWRWLNLEFHHKCQGACDDGTQTSGGYDDTNFDFMWNATWRKKGGSTGGASSVREYFSCPLAPITGCSMPESGHERKYSFYHGIRCLTRYSLEAQARLLDRCNNTSIIQTNLVKIEDHV